MGESRRSPYEILSSLPPVIDLRDVEIATGRDRKAAYNAVARWVLGGYVQQFSYGVYFNLISDRNAPSTHLVDAADRAVPLPKALAGASSLSEAGWTTQMPTGIEMVIATDRNAKNIKSMEGVVTETRSVDWFSRVSPHLIQSPSGFYALPGAFALVDAIMSREAFSRLPREEKRRRRQENSVLWHPDPDDICLPSDMDSASFQAEVLEACDTMRADPDIVFAYLEEVPDFQSLSIAQLQMARHSDVP